MVITIVLATISNISKVTQENVATFHERRLEANYSVLFLDGTYLPLRRGTVSKECIHIALGITPEEQKVFLDMKSLQMKTMLLGPPC